MRYLIQEIGDTKLGERATAESGMVAKAVGDTETRMITLGNYGIGSRTLDNHGTIGTGAMSNLGIGSRELFHSQMRKRVRGESGILAKALGLFYERA